MWRTRCSSVKIAVMQSERLGRSGTLVFLVSVNRDSVFHSGRTQERYPVVDIRAEARHNFEFDTTQVGYPDIIVDECDTSREPFLAILIIIRTELRIRYHGQIHRRIGFIPIPLLAFCVLYRADFLSLAVRSATIYEVGV